MSGDSTKISQLMFKSMMQNFGTDTTNFEQPNSVYRVDNELYIKGVSSAEVPQKKKIEDVNTHPKNGIDKEEENGNKEEKKLDKEEKKLIKEEEKRRKKEEKENHKHD